MESRPARIEVAQRTAFRTNPDAVSRVHQQGLDLIVGERLRIGWVVLKIDKPVPVIPGEAIRGGYPDVTGCILIDVQRLRTRQSVALIQEAKLGIRNRGRSMRRPLRETEPTKWETPPKLYIVAKPRRVSSSQIFLLCFFDTYRHANGP